MDPDIKRLVCDLVGKAFEHHKRHARFEETQRAWMVTAYFTITGLIYGGLIFRPEPLPPSSGLGVIALIVHWLVGICIMISVSKVSGEFRRHFSRAEDILRDVSGLIKENDELKQAFRHVCLETAAIPDAGKGVRDDIVRWTNASVHAYMFSLLTALDVHLLMDLLLGKSVTSLWGLPFAVAWFFLATWRQCSYLTKIGKTGLE